MSLTFTLACSDAAVGKHSHSSEMPGLFHLSSDILRTKE